MKKYFLTEQTARRLKSLLHGRMGATSTTFTPSLVDAASYVPPYTVQWAQSLNSGEGAWIIWLPPGHLSVDGFEKNVAADLDDATGYPEGWYVLDLDGLDAGDDFTLWLDVHAAEDAPFFGIDSEGMTRPVRIADVADDGKMVKQAVKSALVDLEPGINFDGLSFDNDLSITRGQGSSDSSGVPQILTSTVTLLYNGVPIAQASDSVNILQYLIQQVFNQDNGGVVTAHQDSGIVLADKVDPDTEETVGVEIDLKDRPTGDPFGVHTLTVINDKDGSGEYIHILACDDIEIHIPDIPDKEELKGEPGAPGSPGKDGHTPEIYASTDSGVTTIYAEGAPIATIQDGQDGQDGHTPVITAETAEGVTTIKVDGTTVATIQSGEAIQRTSITCISGIRFEVSNGKLKAIVSKQSFHVPDEFEMHPVETIDAETIDVCDVGELDVVASESYSTGNHRFTNTRKKIKVIGTPADTTGQTVFTATPLSEE